MIHTWRMIARKNEVKNIARLEDARVNSNFTAAEVAEFQQIFSMFISKSGNDGDNARDREQAPPPESTPMRRMSVPNLYSAAPKDLGQSTREMLTSVKEGQQEGGPQKSTKSLEALLGIDNVS